jgi:hypothetical protein
MPLASPGAAAAAVGTPHPPPLPPRSPAVDGFPTVTGNEDVVVTLRGYALCESEVKRKLITDFFTSDDSLNNFIKKAKDNPTYAARGGNRKTLGRSAIQNWIRDSGIGPMQRANLAAKKKGAPLPHSIEDATDKISEYISGVKRDKSAKLISFALS